MKSIYFKDIFGQLLSYESVIIDIRLMSRKLQSIYITDEDNYVVLNDRDIALIKDKDINNDCYPTIIKD